MQRPLGMLYTRDKKKNGPNSQSVGMSPATIPEKIVRHILAPDPFLFPFHFFLVIIKDYFGLLTLYFQCILYLIYIVCI